MRPVENYSIQFADDYLAILQKVLSINGGPASCVSRSQAWGRVLVYRLQPPARSHHYWASEVLELKSFVHKRRAPVCHAGLRRLSPGTEDVVSYRFSHEFVRVQSCPVYSIYAGLPIGS